MTWSVRLSPVELLARWFEAAEVMMVWSFLGLLGTYALDKSQIDALRWCLGSSKKPRKLAKQGTR